MASLALLGAAPAAAQSMRPGGLGGAAPPSADDLVKFEVLAPPGDLPPGATFDLAIVMRIAPKWHVYWRNSGDSGLPTDISVRAPAGWTVGEMQWPRPRRFVTEYETTFGYENATALFVPVTIGPEQAVRTAQLEVEVRFMVCQEMCLTGTARRTVQLPFEVPMSSSTLGIVEESRRRLPRETPSEVAVRREGDTLVIEGPAAGADRVDFFPFATPGVEYGAAETSVAEGRYRIAIPLDVRPQNAPDSSGGGRATLRAAGLVALGSADGPSYEISLPLEPR